MSRQIIELLRWQGGLPIGLFLVTLTAEEIPMETGKIYLPEITTDSKSRSDMVAGVSANPFSPTPNSILPRRTMSTFGQQQMDDVINEITHLRSTKTD